MLVSFKELLDFSVAVEDGELGNVADVLLSDDTWTVRYFVVETSDAFEGEPVLISPMAMGPLDRQREIVPVGLTLDRVKKAPRIDAKKPVSRHYEERYYDYYGWPYYWAGGPIWGPFFTPGELARAELRTVSKAGGDVEDPDHPHLRSADEIVTYDCEGRDDVGDLGRIEDLIVDERNYRAKYLELATRKWLPGGKKVLLPTERIGEVSWAGRKVRADVDRDAVDRAPERDRSQPIGTLDEGPIRSHFGVMGRESAESGGPRMSG